jgi:hypothetical protein
MSAPSRFVVELRPPRKGERFIGKDRKIVNADHDFMWERWVIVDPARDSLDVIAPVDPVPADPAAPAEFKRCFQFAPYGGRPAEIAERHADVYPGQVWECTVTPTRRIDSEASVCPVAPSGPSESPTTAHELPDRKWNLP